MGNSWGWEEDGNIESIQVDTGKAATVTLVTIYSRIKEIGIRRAIGATRADIMAQFIIEAMLPGLLGGIAGSGGCRCFPCWRRS